MKNIATIKSATTGKKTFRKVFILSIICLMLPGCVTHMDTADIINGRCYKNTTYIMYNAAYGNGIHEEADNSIKKISLNCTDKDMPANDGAATTTEQDNIPAANNIDIDPLQLIMADNGIDQHDAGEEEKTLKIKFPALMRIAIMMALIVLII